MILLCVCVCECLGGFFYLREIFFCFFLSLFFLVCCLQQLEVRLVCIHTVLLDDSSGTYKRTMATSLLNTTENNWAERPPGTYGRHSVFYKMGSAFSGLVGSHSYSDAEYWASCMALVPLNICSPVSLLHCWELYCTGGKGWVFARSEYLLGNCYWLLPSFIIKRCEIDTDTPILCIKKEQFRRNWCLAQDTIATSASGFTCSLVSL